jgi:thiol:disulfide interchange protein DsbD
VAGAAVVVLGLSGLVVAEADGEIAWLPLTDAAVARAEADGRAVLIDFQAAWCLPCREMERTTFRDPAVVRTAQAFVALKADVTAQDAAAEALMARWKVPGVPTYIVLGPDGRERKRFVGYVAAEEFLGGLRAGLDDPGAEPAERPITQARHG